MSTSANLPIAADRYTPCIRTFVLRGIDMTGVAMQLSVRHAPDTPGQPIADLLTVTNANAEGLRLVDVDRSGPVPISTVALKINESTMAAMPYSGEIGDVTELAYDWQATIGYKRVIVSGAFVVVPGVVGANEAPASRPSGYGTRAKVPAKWQRADLTFGDSLTEVSLTGLDLIAPLIDKAATSADRADAAAVVAAQAAEKRDIIPCDAAARVVNGVTNPNWIILTPKAGYTIAVGSELRFSFAAPATTTSTVVIDVVGFTDGDVRQLLLQNNVDQLPPSLLRQGGYVEVKYLPNEGRFTLVTPVPTYASVITVLQVNSDPSVFQCVMPTGTLLLPGSPTFLVYAPADRMAGEFSGVVLEVDGFNRGDPRQVVYPDGSQIAGNAWRAGARLEIHFDAPTGLFLMTDPPAPQAGAAAGGGMTAFYASMNQQTAALAAFGK